VAPTTEPRPPPCAGFDLGFGCGPDLMLFVLALRQTGPRHTATCLSVLPFVGAVLSVVFPSDRKIRANGW
jgi:hypothetical protein